MIDPGLKEKVVAVTGANNPYGIGAAMARAFAAQGAKVFLHCFRVPHKAIDPADAEGHDFGEAFYYAQGAKKADEVLASLADIGAEASSWEADFADADVIPRLFEEAEEALGPVEILVNNAAAWTADTFIPREEALPNRMVEAWTDRPEQVTAESFRKNFVAPPEPSTPAPPCCLWRSSRAGTSLPIGAGGGSSMSARTAPAVSPPRSATAPASSPWKDSREARPWSWDSLALRSTSSLPDRFRQGGSRPRPSNRL